jgi:hypothetical protein
MLNRLNRTLPTILSIFAILVTIFAVLSAIDFMPIGPIFPQVQLDAARSRWAQSDIESYRIEYQILKPFYSCDYAVKVRLGKVADEEMLSDCIDFFEMIGIDRPSQLDAGIDLTVDAMFGRADGMLGVRDSRNVIQDIRFNGIGYIEEMKVNHCGCPPKGCGISECTDWYTVTHFETLTEP